MRLEYLDISGYSELQWEPIADTKGPKKMNTTDISQQCSLEWPVVGRFLFCN